jgi:flagellar protein FlgJ
MNGISEIGGYLKVLQDAGSLKPGNKVDEKDREKLESAATEFEALFLGQMLSAMRATAGESEEKGFGQTTYTEMFDQEVARSLAKRGSLGIAQLLIRNLENRSVADQNATGSGIGMESSAFGQEKK